MCCSGRWPIATSRASYIRQSLARSILNPGLGISAASVKTMGPLNESFSALEFTMVGLGEPRVVQSAGVVGGSYFEVMGLRPVLGRLDRRHRRWAECRGRRGADAPLLDHALGSDPAVLGKTVRLGERSATIIGVLQPSVPYPSETEIIANVVTSPHHLDATMVDGRVHRMTELFGRLAPGADVDAARAELRAVHRAMVQSHPEAYPKDADFRIDAVRLRDQITSSARTVLLVLLAAAALVFVIACSNVANLILARSVRREGELAIRAALGAGAAALRRTLLAESLLLCGAGAILGVLIARPMVAVLARYASRFSVRALDLTVDSSLLWVGTGLALVAAVLLAFVPRLPSSDRPTASASIERQRPRHVRHQPPAAPVRGDADRRLVRAARRRRHADDHAVPAAGRGDRLQHAPGAGRERAGVVRYGRGTRPRRSIAK